jgi:hypothetical protein
VVFAKLGFSGTRTDEFSPAWFSNLMRLSIAWLPKSRLAWAAIENATQASVSVANFWCIKILKLKVMSVLFERGGERKESEREREREYV